jgi:acetyltransferase
VLGVTVQPMVSSGGYEIIVGSSVDSQFGPVVLFGSGGKLVEVYRDRALALPPLNTTLARRLMEQTKIWTALHGVRGAAAVDLAALERLLVRFSDLIVEQPRIKEIDINPLLVSSEQMRVLDARVVLHPPDCADGDLPRSAIRPYPVQYVSRWALADGTPLIIRPIRPEDEPLMAAFHRTISEQSVYFRYLHLIGLDERIAHERLTRACFIDYAREMALVAEHRASDGTRSILAVGRLTKIRGTNDGEFALVVADAHQRRGIGTELLRRLIGIGQDEGLTRIVATIAHDNRPMQDIVRKSGFAVTYNETDRTAEAVLTL